MAYKPKVLSIPGGGTGFSANEYFIVSFSGGTDVTGNNTEYVIPYDTYISPSNPNFNTSTGVYTVPANGNYLYAGTVNCTGLLVSHTTLQFKIKIDATNIILLRISPFVVSGSAGDLTFSFSNSVNLTAASSVSFSITVAGGTKVVDLPAGLCTLSISRIFGT